MRLTVLDGCMLAICVLHSLRNFLHSLCTLHNFIVSLDCIVYCLLAILNIDILFEIQGFFAITLAQFVQYS